MGKYIDRDEVIKLIKEDKTKTRPFQEFAKMTGQNGYAMFLRGVNHTCDSLIKAIKGLHPANVVERKNGKWIPVTERLPEPGIDVLVKQTFSYPYVTHGWRTATYWEWVAYPSDHKKKNPTSFSSICPGNEFVTHWMPLPSAPTEE